MSLNPSMVSLVTTRKLWSCFGPYLSLSEARNRKILLNNSQVINHFNSSKTQKTESYLVLLLFSQYILCHNIDCISSSVFSLCTFEGHLKQSKESQKKNPLIGIMLSEHCRNMYLSNSSFEEETRKK